MSAYDGWGTACGLVIEYKNTLARTQCLRIIMCNVFMPHNTQSNTVVVKITLM